MHSTLRCVSIIALSGLLTTSALAETAATPRTSLPESNTITGSDAPLVTTTDSKLTELLAETNALYDRRDPDPEISKVPDAIAGYEKILAIAPQHYSALWRLARCYWWQGDHALKGKQIELYDKGKIYAQRAQQAAPDKVNGYYWFGVNEGRAAEIRGIFNSLFAINPIREAMQKVLALNKKDGSAHHVLSILYRKAPGWPLACGDINKSLEHARLAVGFSPDEVAPRMDLAKTLIAKGQKEGARKLLLEALELPGPANLQPETKKDKIKTQAVLDELN